MMGHLQSGQNSLFYDFNLEKHIPVNHLLRKIDQYLDFSTVREYLEPYYSHTGRPSIDPELMLRMLLIGYCYGIRSERRLCEEVNFNLAYRWFCKLGLEDDVPEHSTFSKNRHGRYRDSDCFRYLFDQVVTDCFKRGLVKAEGFAVDASLVAADTASGPYTSAEKLMENFDKAHASRAVKEYFEALDKHELPEKTFKKISPTDPMSHYLTHGRGNARYCYSTNYLVDISQNIIVDVEATSSYRVSEVNSTKTMINRVEKKHDVIPKRLMGDTAYGTAELLNWTVEKGITPHSPVWDKSGRQDGTYERADFDYDKNADEFICPQGKRLRTTGSIDKGKFKYRSSTLDCQLCPDKPKCTPITSSRGVYRSIYEEARDIARAEAKTPEYAQSRKDRKKVEIVFAHLKNILHFNRLRLRGLSGASDEMLLAATAQNLRRMAKVCT